MFLSISENNNRQWNHFIAGACAGIVSRTLTAPLDRLKLMSQLLGKTIYPLEGVRYMMKEGGFFSMWRGNGANLLKIVPELAIKFGVFQEMKKYFTKDDSGLSTANRFLSAGVSGAAGHAIVHPIEVCKTRLALRKTGDPPKLRTVARLGYSKYGMSYFFRGFKTSMASMVVFTAFHFTTYEKTKNIYVRLHRFDSKGILICSAFSSICSMAVAYPLSVIATFFQVNDDKRSFLDFLKFAKSRGRFGLYKGLTASLIKGVPMLGITYLVFESTLESLGDAML